MHRRGLPLGSCLEHYFYYISYKCWTYRKHMKTVISSIPYFKFLSLHDSSYHWVSAVSFSNEIPRRIFCLANCACEQLTVSGVPAGEKQRLPCVMKCLKQGNLLPCRLCNVGSKMWAHGSGAPARGNALRNENWQVLKQSPAFGWWMRIEIKSYQWESKDLIWLKLFHEWLSRRLSNMSSQKINHYLCYSFFHPLNIILRTAQPTGAPGRGNFIQWRKT